MKITFYDSNISLIIQNKEKIFGGASIDLLNQILILKSHSKCDITVMTSLFEKQSSAKLNTRDFYNVHPDLKKPFGRLSFVLSIPKILICLKIIRPNFVTFKGAGFVPFVIALCCQLLDIKYVYQIANDVETDERVRDFINPLIVPLFFFALKRASIIRCQNDYQYQNLKLIFPQKNILKLPNFFFYEYMPKFERKNFRLLWIGRFKKQKGVDRLIKLIKELPQYQFELAADIHSINEKHPLYKTICELKSLENVTLLGFLSREKLKSKLNETVAVINTSYFEGMPNSFIEAWHYGCQVLYFSDILKNQNIQQSGAGFCAQSLDEFKNNISNLANMVANGQSELLFNNSQNYFLKNFHIKKQSKSLETLFSIASN